MELNSSKFTIIHVMRCKSPVSSQYTIWPCPGPEDIKHFSCSTQLSTKFQLLIKTEIPTNKEVSCLYPSEVVFIMLINVKMPTIVGILTFMSRMNFVPS